MHAVRSWPLHPSHFSAMTKVGIVYASMVMEWFSPN
jgi:hypothetical protein